MVFKNALEIESVFGYVVLSDRLTSVTMTAKRASELVKVMRSGGEFNDKQLAFSHGPKRTQAGIISVPFFGKHSFEIRQYLYSFDSLLLLIRKMQNAIDEANAFETVGCGGALLSYGKMNGVDFHNEHELAAILGQPETAVSEIGTIFTQMDICEEIREVA